MACSSSHRRSTVAEQARTGQNAVRPRNRSRYAFSVKVPCDASPGLAWTIDVFPGTYRISTVGDGQDSDVPDASFVAFSALVVPAPD